MMATTMAADDDDNDDYNGNGSMGSGANGIR